MKGDGAVIMTRSEAVFERFLNNNNLQFEKIKTADTPRPDYLVTIGDLKVVFEVKEIGDDEKFGVAESSSPDVKFSSRTLGDHVRRRIESARRQVQWGSRQGIPSALLIYNNLDPLQLFGTENIDFETAMYGEKTMLIDKTTGQHSEVFNGRNQLLRQYANTSFGAVGRLCDRTGTPSVTLFENTFAQVQLPYNELPPCFEVRRVEVNREPLSFR